MKNKHRTSTNLYRKQLKLPLKPLRLADQDGVDGNCDPIPLTDASASLSSSSSQPLDENLFSDLTLITPNQFRNPLLDPSPTPISTSTTREETPSVSRQISRKKKRASLRIGYGRDSLNQLSLVDDAEVQSSPSDDSHSQTKSFSLLPDETLDSHPSPPTTSQAILTTCSTSTEANFDRVRAIISEKLHHARQLAASISASRKDSMRRRRKAAQNLNLASTKSMELEKELEEACEAEDFEMAERLSQSLAGAEKDKQAFIAALRDAEAECDAIDSKMQEVLERQITAEEECVSLLEQFATDAANNANEISKRAQFLSSKEMDQWFSSTEALEVRKLELEIESHLISDTRLLLNDSIEHAAEDERREREFLCKRKDTLMDELEKLLALVREKEDEIAENDANIKAVDKRIADVVSGFQEMHLSINMKYDNLQSSLSQTELESEALSMKKKEIDDLLSEEEERGAKLRELARISADEAKAYEEVVGLRKSFALSIVKSREDKLRLAKTEEKLSEEVQILRQEVSAARASLQELSSTKSSIQQEIASSKQRIFFIDKIVPELEAEKKVAAAARNFKEAARVAAEAKKLSVEKEGEEVKMDGAMLELGKLEEEIKDTVNWLVEADELILFKEKEVAMARFQRLLLVAGAAKAERLAAVELGDLEEANLLLAEAEAAEVEAKNLEQSYNFKEEEFENLPKHFMSMELVSNLGGKQLAELAASVHLPALYCSNRPEPSSVHTAPAYNGASGRQITFQEK
ncbi:unnamed protein product, partial [Vitis vinifera]